MNLLDFQKELQNLNVIFSEEEINDIMIKFDKFYNFLEQENKKYDLTSIKGKEEAYLKHFYDSIYIMKFIKLHGKILDIGSGAGFPGIPLAILNPDVEFYLVEPTTKRCNFMQNVKELLGISNIIIINDRVEHLEKKYRESFDFVTSRAVASLEILTELSVPYLKVNGYFIPFKGSSYKEEITKAKKALNILSCKLELVKEYKLDENYGRSLLFFKKTCKTLLKYPRNYSIIKQKPL